MSIFDQNRISLPLYVTDDSFNVGVQALLLVMRWSAFKVIQGLVFRNDVFQKKKRGRG